MRLHLSALAPSLLLASLLGLAVTAHAQQAPIKRPSASELSSASVTSNVPPRAGEASTMTDGVPNAATSNVQPGELGIQTRLTVRKYARAPVALPEYARAPVAAPDLKLMGAPGSGRN